ncbi:cell wall glucanase [Coccidioides immitis RS]|uniref:Crh-like protein n=2 Tax=Coccidioides immitis TaxID=5501 RepID=J3KIF5_COCIM|nr:cell wall glucanase [Coccidioides immitis RS]EAS35748.3 cell wall glucanase [Coccidioides immitis RS]KMP01030.1 ice nucleation protein [Coccidioides immitis RMSCC 2394]
MKLTASAVAAFVAAPLLATAQTYTKCDPTKQSCPADPALSGTATFDLKSPSERFTELGKPTYNDEGVSFTINKQGDYPTIQSNFYIMFGHFEVEVKAAPGRGIVSSVVMQSDCLDEIDWEWIGGNNGQVQSNFFKEGRSNAYDRAVWHPNPGNQDGFHKYAVDWTSERIEFYLDGEKIRTVTPNDGNARGNYPQTPMFIKIGIWAGGDPTNGKGTIEWAGGETDFSAAPFTMQARNIVITDYSTGKEYRYGDRSGTWQSIEAVDGEVRSSGRPGSGPEVGSSVPPAEKTASPSGHSVHPWIPPNPTTTLSTARESITGIAGLPSSWLVTDDGRPTSPSTASTASLTTSLSSPSSPDSPSSGGPDGSQPTGTNGEPDTGRGSNPSATIAPENSLAHISSPYHGLAAICGIIGLVVLL